jgi:hypothetical protein
MAASAIIEDLGKKPPVMAMASISEESSLVPAVASVCALGAFLLNCAQVGTVLCHS